MRTTLPHSLSPVQIHLQPLPACTRGCSKAQAQQLQSTSPQHHPYHRYPAQIMLPRAAALPRQAQQLLKSMRPAPRSLKYKHRAVQAAEESCYGLSTLWQRWKGLQLRDEPAACAVARRCPA